MITKYCPNCGKMFETTSGVKKFCGTDCQKIFESKIKYKNVKDAVICKECGMMGESLLKHIVAKHSSIEEYCQKHNCTKDDLISETGHQKLSNAQKKIINEGHGHQFTSDRNPSKSDDCKSGRNSPYSMNFRGYDGLTEQEKKDKINELYNKKIKSMNENCNNPLKKEYYIKRGYTEDEATNAIKERQSTFTLEKCIEKYGEDEGLKRWQERQKKWMNTLNSKSEEEKIRINKAKAMGLSFSKGYSKISQELFWKLYNILSKNYKNIYFATLGINGDYVESNNEYIVENKLHHYFLDFYVEDNNKVIEFDGDYWHGDGRGNKERDNNRESELKELGFIIKRVKERDYKTNPDKVIKECIEFINL